MTPLEGALLQKTDDAVYGATSTVSAIPRRVALIVSIILTSISYERVDGVGASIHHVPRSEIILLRAPMLIQRRDNRASVYRHTSKL